MKYLIALIMLVSFNTFAGDVIVGFKSYHFDRKAEFNETNPTIGYDFDNGLGVLYTQKNSIERKTVMATYRYQYFDSKYLSSDVRVGVASGYPDKAKYNGDYTYHQHFGSGNFRAIASLDFNIKTSKAVETLVTVNPAYIGLGFKIKL